MSQENVEIVRRIWDAYGSEEDFAAGLEFFSDDVITRRGPSIVHPMTYEGPEGVLQSLLDWVENFDEFNQTAEEIIDAGDHVLCRIRQRAHGSQSGVAVESDFWFAFTIRDDKVVRMEMHTTREQALKAAEESV